MQHTTKPYLPAAGSDWLLPFYDTFTRLLGVDKAHHRLILQASIQAGHQVLEIGCGTGNMAIQVKKLNPGAQVVGIDPDPKALERARRKARRISAMLQFDQGFSQELPYPEASFDRVLSAFMLHHLQPDVKLLTMKEVFRVLKPGGSLHLVDFEEAQHYGGGLHGFIAGRMHARHGSSPQQVVLDLMSQAGFEESRQLADQSTLIGRIVYYEAVRSQSPNSSSG